MNRHDESLQALGTDLKAARSATVELTSQLRRLSRRGGEARRRVASACGAGGCSAGYTGGDSRPAGGQTTGRFQAGIQSAVSRAALSDLSRSLATGLGNVLRNALTGFTRALAGLVSRRSGGGMFGGLLGGLVGGGLNLLVDRLFSRRQKVKVENTIQAEVLNFPRLSDLGLATNPASRLLGGRSVARGPAFTVTVDYRSGAEDLVAAKVASRLADLNELHGVH